MKQRWHFLTSRQGFDLTTIAAINVAYDRMVRRFYGRSGRNMYTLFQDRTLTYYTVQDPEEFGARLCARFFPRISSVLRFVKQGRQDLRDSQIRARQWIRKIERRKEPSDIQEALAVFQRDYEYFMYWYNLVPFIGLNTWEVQFNGLLRRLAGKRSVQLDESVTSQILRSRWPNALQRIAKKKMRGVPVRTLQRDYKYMRSWSVVWYEPLKSSWFHQLPEPIPPKRGIQSLTQTLNALRLSSVERQQIQLAPYMSFLKDWRDELRRAQVFAWSPLVDTIAKQLHCRRDDLGYFSFDEIATMLSDGHMDRPTLQYRRDHACVVTAEKNGKAILYDRRIPGRFPRPDDQNTALIKELTGVSAQRGIVTGRVAMVRSFQDVKRVRSGQIMVAHTTHPEYLPAMVKAAAFVTDEGGIMSHAAIVAREMGKPCIVGTKTATRVLKNGDRVEVDAEHGVVRKTS